MTRVAFRRVVQCAITIGMAALCGGCLPIGARWSNMFVALVG